MKHALRSLIFFFSAGCFLFLSTPLAAEEKVPAPEPKDTKDTTAEPATGVPATAPPAARVPATVPPVDASTQVTPPKEPNQFWTTEFEPIHLKMISPRDGAGVSRVYWYMIYTLSNSGKEDRDLFVSISAVTDGKKQYSDLFLPAVEKVIEKKEKEPLWGKSDEFELARKREPKDPKMAYVTLKAGETRKCVAVFNAIDPNVSRLTIGVRGLTNDIKLLTKDDGMKELEERVREFSYERPGDEYEITLDRFKLTGREWVKKRVPLAVAVAPPASK
jgi:hypothetical protein